MILIKEEELQQLLTEQYNLGIKTGIDLMKRRILLACKNGNSIEINQRAYFIKNDIQNLRDIMNDRVGGNISN